MSAVLIAVLKGLASAGVSRGYSSESRRCMGSSGSV